MEIVNYALQEFTYARVSASLPTIDYIMVDEVQDLCCATIKLLTKLCKFNIFFSGDSAQSIAKGVGFRFGDLKSIVQSADGSFDGGIMQLTQNFRSQNNILQLAHSVIEIIEQFFPETIDILNKESSQVVGPKPILFSSNESSHIINQYFTGAAHQEIHLSKVEFGCEQVVIVRSQ
jgi:superfamily I DNA/RNA helicase